MFLEVYPGGGTRRNPKRKTAGASSLAGPSAADTRRVFQEHVARMARGGVWGDNMEIQAFTAAFDWSVKIYQFDMAYVIPAPSGEDEGRTAHIAYHVGLASQHTPGCFSIPIDKRGSDMGTLLFDT